MNSVAYHNLSCCNGSALLSYKRSQRTPQLISRQPVVGMTIAALAQAMTITHAYTLLLEAALAAASLAALWLSFWIRHRRQLGFARIFPLISFPGKIAARGVKPPGEKDQAILHRPEDAQHLRHKPQVKAEQHQSDQLEPVESNPVIHNPVSVAGGSAGSATVSV